jgi:hypothetical protein
MSYVPKQMYFNMNDENVMTLECFNMETNAVWQFRQVNNCLSMAI